jgi:hypothetical protein
MAVPPRPQPATAEQIALARRLTRFALLSAVAAPLVTMLALPLSAIPGAAFGIGAIVLGIRERRASSRAGRTEAGGIVAIVLGSMGIALVSVIGAFYAVFWDQLSNYQDCLGGANTIAAENDCREQLESEVMRRLGR